MEVERSKLTVLPRRPCYWSALLVRLFISRIKVKVLNGTWWRGVALAKEELLHCTAAWIQITGRKCELFHTFEEWVEDSVGGLAPSGVKAVSQRNQKGYFLIVSQQLHSNAQINVSTPPHNPAGRRKSSRSWVNSDEVYNLTTDLQLFICPPHRQQRRETTT